MRHFAILALLLAAAAPLTAQAVATMPVTDAKLSGAVEVKAKQVDLSSGASVQSGDEQVPITLSRGGDVQLCQNSTLHISKGANAGEVMLALDRGAMELHSKLGQFSDVLLTPDLRMLISGPADANVQVRINQQGDTCVDNQGSNAPYVTITEQLSSAIYRVRAGQHVLFERGSVGQVVDNEREPCGCPPPAPAVEVAGNKPPFPLAESEGLTKPAAASTTPVVPPGETHEQVSIPFAYNGAAAPAPPSSTPPSSAPPPPTTQPSTPASGSAAITLAPSPAMNGAIPANPAPTAATTQNNNPDAWTSIKRFFRKLFGKH